VSVPLARVSLASRPHAPCRGNRTRRVGIVAGCAGGGEDEARSAHWTSRRVPRVDHIAMKGMKTGQFEARLTARQSQVLRQRLPPVTLIRRASGLVALGELRRQANLYCGQIAGSGGIHGPHSTSRPVNPSAVSGAARRQRFAARRECCVPGRFRYSTRVSRQVGPCLASVLLPSGAKLSAIVHGPPDPMNRRLYRQSD
jgi:hypothetical protein